MKTKFLFSTLVMAAAFSACTQEEVAMNNEVAGNMNEVAGAVLLGNGLSVVSGETGESRVAIVDGKAIFTKGDKAAVAWAVKQSGKVTDEQKPADLTGLSSTLYANHMLAHNGTAFESRGNIYEGWHFAYRPFVYMSKPQQLVLDVNASPLTKTDLNIDKYENAPMFSNALFLNEDNVVTEEGRVTAEMEMNFIVNSLRPALNISPEFTENEALQNIKITGITLSAGDNKLFTPSIKVQPKYLEDMAATDDEGNNVSPYIKSSYFGEDKAFAPAEDLTNAVTTSIDNAEAYNLGKSKVQTRIFLAPTQDAADVELSDLSFRIDVAGGHFDVKYTSTKDNEGNDVELTELEETNNKAIQKLLYWLNGEKDDELNANGRDLKNLYVDYEKREQNPNCSLELSLAIENFVADYLINDITDWTGSVTLADALGEENPVFTLGKNEENEDAVVVFNGEEIPAPANGVTVRGEGKLVVASNLTWNNDVVVERTESGLSIEVEEDAQLSVVGGTLAPYRLYNNGTILADATSTIGAKGYNSLYSNNRIVIEYGAYVYPRTGSEGTIAYVVTKDDVTKPYRIANLVGKDEQKGYANVNTIIINKPISIDFTKPVAGTPGSTEEDPYVDMTTPGVGNSQYNYGDLSNIAIEINGATVKSSSEEITVKTIEMKGGNVSGINVTDKLTLVEGTNTVNNTSIGSVDVTNGKNTITTNKISGDVNIEAGTNTINDAEITGKVTVNAGSVTLNDVNKTGDLVNKGTATINGEGIVEIANIDSYGTLNANTDVVVETIAVNYGSKANVAEEKTIWYTIPQNQNGYIQDGTTSGRIRHYGTEQFLNDLKAVEDGATVTLKSDVELTAMETIEKNITIDLNGKTLSFTGNEDHPAIKNTGILNIVNGKIKSEGVGVQNNGTLVLNCNIESNKNAVNNVYDGKTTIEGGSYKSTAVLSSAIVSDGWYTGKPELIINGGTFEAYFTCISYNNASTGAVNKGTFTTQSEHCIYVGGDSGDCDVTYNAAGCQFNNQGSKATVFVGDMSGTNALKNKVNGQEYTGNSTILSK